MKIQLLALLLLACTACHGPAFTSHPKEIAFEDTLVQFQFCPSGDEHFPTLAHISPARCPDVTEVKAVLKLVPHSDVIANSNTIIVFVADYIDCGSNHDAIGCELNQAMAIRDTNGRWQTLRHELVHAELEKRGVPAACPGDPRHTLPIWKIIEASHSDSDTFYIPEL